MNPLVAILIILGSYLHTWRLIGRQRRRCNIPQAVTQSSAPEDWQNNFQPSSKMTT